MSVFFPCAVALSFWSISVRRSLVGLARSSSFPAPARSLVGSFLRSIVELPVFVEESVRKSPSLGYSFVRSSRSSGSIVLSPKATMAWCLCVRFLLFLFDGELFGRRHGSGQRPRATEEESLSFDRYDTSRFRDHNKTLNILFYEKKLIAYVE